NARQRLQGGHARGGLRDHLLEQGRGPRPVLPVRVVQSEVGADVRGSGGDVRRLRERLRGRRVVAQRRVRGGQAQDGVQVVGILGPDLLEQGDRARVV